MSEYPLILPPRRLTAGMVDVAFEKDGPTYNVGVEVGRWDSIKKYIGLGSSVSTAGIRLIGDEEHTRFRVTRCPPWRTYRVMFRRGGFPTPQARGFIAMTNTQRGEEERQSARRRMKR